MDKGFITTVAGHMTIYLTRTNENPFWTRPFPAAALFFTAEATQIIGTLIAVYGVFMHPIGWKLAGFVWGYALVFFVVNDFIKVRLYRILTHRGLVFHR